MVPALRGLLQTNKCIVKYTKVSMKRNHMVRSIKQILNEELTAADKRDIEKIARRQAQIIIDRVVGPDFGKTIKDEVEKALGSKATRDEIAEVVEVVLKRLHRELAAGKK